MRPLLIFGAAAVVALAAAGCSDDAEPVASTTTTITEAPVGDGELRILIVLDEGVDLDPVLADADTDPSSVTYLGGTHYSVTVNAATIPALEAALSADQRVIAVSVLDEQHPAPVTELPTTTTVDPAAAFGPGTQDTAP